MLKIRKTNDYMLEELVEVVYKCLAKDMDVNIFEHFSAPVVNVIRRVLNDYIIDMYDERNNIHIYSSMSLQGMTSNFDRVLEESSANKLVFVYKEDVKFTKISNNTNLTPTTSNVYPNKETYECYVEVSDWFGICQSFVQFNTYYNRFDKRPILEITKAKKSC